MFYKNSTVIHFLLTLTLPYIKNKMDGNTKQKKGGNRDIC